MSVGRVSGPCNQLSPANNPSEPPDCYTESVKNGATSLKVLEYAAELSDEWRWLKLERVGVANSKRPGAAPCWLVQQVLEFCSQ